MDVWYNMSNIIVGVEYHIHEISSRAFFFLSSSDEHIVVNCSLGLVFSTAHTHTHTQCGNFIGVGLFAATRL